MHYNAADTNCCCENLKLIFFASRCRQKVTRKMRMFHCKKFFIKSTRKTKKFMLL